MGWGRALLLGDIGVQMNVEDQIRELEQLRQEVRSRRADSGDTAARLADLERECDELRLYLAAVCRLLVAQGVVTPEALRQAVEAVDAEDGAADVPA